MKRTLILALPVVVAIGAYLLFRTSKFSSDPHPASSYQAAMQKFAELEKSESSLPLSPEGKSRIFSHGKKTERVFVLLHGLTNCPEQFVPLAKILFQSGANVVIPRARYAGYTDLMNGVQGLQSAQDLLDQAAQGLDIAAGLGDRVSLVGLSGSAVAATWMAANRDGIESVLILSPFFSLHGHPVWQIDGLAAILSKVPNFYKWWNDDLKENNPGPAYAYRRYGTRCMADVIQLSRVVRSRLSTQPLRAGRLDILITGTDKGAHNDLTNQLAAEWAAKNPGHVTIFEFPEKAGVPHDMVDPYQPEQKIRITYPRILELLGVPSAPPSACDSPRQTGKVV